MQITKKHGEPLGLAFVGRGFDVRIGVPFGGTLSDAFTVAADECVRSCPTAALAFRDEES